MYQFSLNIDEIVNDVPVFPNEIFSYIINLTLQSDVTMLRTINRVSKMFKEVATTAMQCSAQVFKRAGCHLKMAHLAR